MNFLLDTNAWLRLFQFPGEIATEVRSRLNREDVLGLSPFSLIEIAQKNAPCPLHPVQLRHIMPHHELG